MSTRVEYLTNFATHHYFVSTIMDWRVASSLGEAIAAINRTKSWAKGQTWRCYRVEGELHNGKCNYAVQDYLPQVDGFVEFVGDGVVGEKF